MKRAWFVLAGGLIVGVLAYACIYFNAQRSFGNTSKPALAWLQDEYHLTNAQFARVRELHEAYQPKCVEMCRKIDEKNAELQKLLASTNVITPEIKQTLAESAQLRTDCQAAMLEHFYEVASVMPPEQGKRYLDWVQQETLMPGRMPPTQPQSASSSRSP